LGLVVILALRLELLHFAAELCELGPPIAGEDACWPLAGVAAGALDPVVQGGLGPVEVLGDLGDDSVADRAQFGRPQH